MRLVRWGVILVMFGFGAAAQAGTIHPGLEAEMSRSAPGTPFSVIVHLTDQVPVPEMSRVLADRHATRAESHQTIVEALQTTAAQTQGPLKQDLDSGLRRGEVFGYTSYWISNLLVVHATKEEVIRLASRLDVDLIEMNFTVSLMTPIDYRIPEIEYGPDGELDGPRGIGVTPGLYAINAPQAWNELGITGAGRLVANLDTGVDGNHPALSTRWRGYNGQHPWQECWLDVLAGNTQFPTDNYGHGTHVMGTECGAGHASGDTVGVAWEAQWIACNAINQGVGGEFDNDVITAFQWFADPDGNSQTVDDVPDVVQNSWRINENFGGNYTDCDERWWAVIDNCEAAGCVTTWSAGNEGPGGTSIGSPPDRATTLTNTFSVGAVDATNYGWPYPIAGFSSRGPSGCDGVPQENLTKPEVVAPGVDVYSSVPGGGYSQNWSGTSMAGPHVAGVVGLMRQANPNIGVEDIKTILMETALDLGQAGEENTFGWGIVDAYAAVVMATTGFAEIEGHVRNASFGEIPISAATVTLVEIDTEFETDATGYYGGSAPAAMYTVEASHPGFESESVAVEMIAGAPVVQDFSLVDNAGPMITNVSEPGSTTQSTGTYTLYASITDPSTVASATFFYRVRGGLWQEVTMFGGLGGLYSANIGAEPSGSWIDYYVRAVDGAGLTSLSPESAPDDFYTLFVTTEVFTDDVEQDNGWSLEDPGDTATSGHWVREDPVGTIYEDEPFQTEDDHTVAPGTICFITGNGDVGGFAGDADVDGGCTSLTTPAFDLTGATQAFMSYHRWYAEGITIEDVFEVLASSDGGESWLTVETVYDSDPAWRKVSIDLAAYLEMTDAVQLRFVACDISTGSLIEAGIDDFSLETFVPLPADAPDGGAPRLRSRLAQNQPNPFNPVTAIEFTISNPADARLLVHDAAGRLVRTLVDGSLTAGTHRVLWDGKDDAGRSVGSGIYFYHLKAGGFEQSRRMTILK